MVTVLVAAAIFPDFELFTESVHTVASLGVVRVALSLLNAHLPVTFHVTFVLDAGVTSDEVLTVLFRARIRKGFVGVDASDGNTESAPDFTATVNA